MLRRFSTLFVTLGLLLGFAAPLTVASTVEAAPYDVFKSCQNVQSEICTNQKDQTLFGAGSIWSRIINMLIFLVGAVSVVMIVVGGLRYATSGGDSSAISSAKNTILYSIVGIVISVSAYAIVNFVATNI